MDPEQAQELLRLAREALRQGRSLEQVNSKLPEITGGEVDSFDTLVMVASGQDPEEQRALERQAERGDSALGNFGRMVGQGASFGFGDELAGVVEGLKALGPGGESFGEARQRGTEESRQRVEDIRTTNPGSALAAEGIGGLLTGAGAAGGAAKALGTTGRGLLTAGSRTTPVKTLARAAGRGTGAGAAEGAVFGAGEAEGGVADRAPGALFGGALGGAAGLVGGTLLAAPGAAMRTIRGVPEAGERLADDLVDAASGGERKLPSSLRQASQEKAQRARKIFQELEEAGPVQKEEVLRVVERNPRVQEALSSRARAAVEKLNKGETLGESELLTFTQIDDAATNLKRTADAFRRGAEDVRAEDVRAASQAFDELDTAMRESLEEFPDAKRLWAEKSAEMRALSEGRKIVGKSADDIRSALEKVPEGAREYFRQGMLHERISDLERFRGGLFSAPEATQPFFKRGRGFEKELKLMFPDEESYNRFARQVDITRAEASFAEKAKILTQAAAFLYGGTSIFGRLLGD